jgi:hypothetical protein
MIIYYLNLSDVDVMIIHYLNLGEVDVMIMHYLNLSDVDVMIIHYLNLNDVESKSGCIVDGSQLLVISLLYILFVQLVFLFISNSIMI